VKAINGDHAAALKVLLTSGASVTYHLPAGNSLAKYAVVKQKWACLAVLIGMGASVDQIGTTALGTLPSGACTSTPPLSPLTPLPVYHTFHRQSVGNTFGWVGLPCGALC
jgi:hypothetical protein